MPNIKSAIKRVEIAQENTKTNRAAKSRISTYIKRFKKALAENDLVTAEAEYRTVAGLLDSAARKNIIHANSASRKSAHLAKLLSDAKAK